MIDLLLTLAGPAIRYADDPQRNYWRVHVLVYTLFVWIIDMVLAHTVWAWYFGWPERKEWTISHTLERLCKTPGPYQQFHIAFSKKINRESPTGNHIKAVSNE